MNENKDGENKLNYSIPGVIIPKQETENGQILESNEIKEVPVENNQVVPEEQKEPVAPQVPVSEEQKEPVAPQVPVSSLESQNSGTYLSVPNMNDVPKFDDDTSNKKKKKEKKVKVKKVRNNDDSNYKYIVIILLLLGGLGYFIYNDYFVPKEEVDPVKELQRQRTLNNNSLVVQELFNYVNLDGCGDQINFFYNGNETINLADLSNENKNYLAYRVLKHKDIEIKNCENYSSALNKNDPVKLWHCGNYLDSGKEDTTEVISSEVLKKQVEKMFGEGSYKDVTFTTASSGRFLFDSKTSNYIYQTFDGKNNTCSGWTNILNSVYRQNNNIVLSVKTTNNKTKVIYLFDYTFQESDNGNYYFVSMHKKKI